MRQMQEKRKGRFVEIAVLGLIALAVAAPAAFGANTGPLITFNPATHDYGNLGANGIGSQVFVLTNTGRGATGVLDITLGTTSGPFSITADTCNGKKLSPTKSCSVTVRYTQATATSSDSGALFAFTTRPPLGETVTLNGGVLISTDGVSSG